MQQHAAVCANGRNMQHPTMLGVVGQQCCVRLICTWHYVATFEHLSQHFKNAAVTSHRRKLHGKMQGWKKMPVFWKIPLSL